MHSFYDIKNDSSFPLIEIKKEKTNLPPIHTPKSDNTTVTVSTINDESTLELFFFIMIFSKFSIE